MINPDRLKRFIYTSGRKTRVLFTYKEDDPELRKLHEVYLNFIDTHFVPLIFSHAYTKNRSIYTNAKAHMFNDVFVKIDIKNFFPTINHRQLTKALYYELNKNKPGTITRLECATLVNNCSIAKAGLPLGLITSPALSNIYLKSFDGALYGELKKLKLTNLIYTRYADDIFISFQSPEKPSDSLLQGIVDIAKQKLKPLHLHINDKKTRFISLHESNHVKLAGINLVRYADNRRRLTVSRKTIKEMFHQALELHSAIKNPDGNNVDAKIRQLKGLHSFVLSVEKTGYSHVLSPTMQGIIKSAGYSSLEELIAQMKTQAEK